MVERRAALRRHRMLCFDAEPTLPDALLPLPSATAVCWCTIWPRIPTASGRSLAGASSSERVEPPKRWSGRSPRSWVSTVRRGPAAVRGRGFFRITSSLHEVGMYFEADWPGQLPLSVTEYLPPVQGGCRDARVSLGALRRRDVGLKQLSSTRCSRPSSHDPSPTSGTFSIGHSVSHRISRPRLLRRHRLFRECLPRGLSAFLRARAHRVPACWGPPFRADRSGARFCGAIDGDRF